MNNATTPAFPIWTPDMPVEGTPGLTKRELFAAMAMQGFVSNPGRIGSIKETAEAAVVLADAVLAELTNSHRTLREITNMSEKLDHGQRHLIRLIRKGQDDEGWAKVSKVILPLAKDRIPAELADIEGPFEDGSGRARLTERGNAVLDLAVYF